MWQFGYVVHLCQQALRKQLVDQGVREVENLLQPAMQHSERFLEQVLEPLFIGCEEERSNKIYLSLVGIATVRLAQVAPIQGFQQNSDFQDQLAAVSQQWTQQQLCDYMQHNVEARSKRLYAIQSPDTCCTLFSIAPLPRVCDMLSIALNANWSQGQQQRAICAVDFNRMLTGDLDYVQNNRQQLPQDTSIFYGLWQAATRFAHHSHVSSSMKPPWTFHFHSDSHVYASEILTVWAGPVRLKCTISSGGGLHARFTTPKFKASHALHSSSACDSKDPAIRQSGESFRVRRHDFLLIIL